MRNVMAIAERELRAYFSSPIAYVVLAIFALLAGYFFQSILAQVLQVAMMQQMQGGRMGAPPQPMDMPGLVSRGFLQSLSVIFLFLMPMITMALFSEEKKRGTIELLLTAPLTNIQVVMGKYFGASAFFLILIGVTLVPMSLLFIWGEPAPAPLFTGYLGMILYGLTLVAIGLFVSTLTENQIISAVITFGVILSLWLIEVMTNESSPTVKAVFGYIGLLGHLDDFIRGVLNTTHVLFYLSFITLGIFLTYRSIESMRWRG